MATNAEYLSILAKVECRDSTYLPKSSPLVFAKAKGSLIWDVEGTPFIDLCAGFGVMAMGHASPVWQELLNELHCDDPMPILHGMGDVYPSRAKVELLQKLQSMLPTHLSRGALALTGSQAIEIALKTAMLATKKSGFICFHEGYHGVDLGALPLTYRDDFKAPFRDWLREDHVVSLPYNASKEDLEAAVLTLRSRGCGFAGVLVEPIQGRAGMIFPKPTWFQDLREVCNAEQGLLIVDEIFTGLGRTGSMIASQGFHADLICLGKALGGGMPLSACFGSEEVMNAWPLSQGEAIHTGTFFGHPFSCEVALRTLAWMERSGIFARVKNVGAEILARLFEIKAKSPLIRDVRGEGFFIGVEFTRDGLGAQLMDEMRARGVIMLASGPKGQCIAMTPALTIEKSLWLEAIDRFEEALLTLSESLPKKRAIAASLEI